MLITALCLKRVTKLYSLITMAYPSCQYKVSEKCVAWKLIDFISDWLYYLQHRFRSSLSCTMQLLCMFLTTSALGNGDEIDLAYVNLNLIHAFDSVCHSILLCKPQDIGISGSLLFWFSDYCICHFANSE